MARRLVALVQCILSMIQAQVEFGDVLESQRLENSYLGFSWVFIGLIHFPYILNVRGFLVGLQLVKHYLFLVR